MREVCESATEEWPENLRKYAVGKGSPVRHPRTGMWGQCVGDEHEVDQRSQLLPHKDVAKPLTVRAPSISTFRLRERQPTQIPPRLAMPGRLWTGKQRDVAHRPCL